MRQILLRVPDDVHDRLVDRARREHRSMNAVATELLQTNLPEPPGDVRTALRARARLLGVLAPSRPRRGDVDRIAALASSRGRGPILDELLADGR